MGKKGGKTRKKGRKKEEKTRKNEEKGEKGGIMRKREEEQGNNKVLQRLMQAARFLAEGSECSSCTSFWPITWEVAGRSFEGPCRRRRSLWQKGFSLLLGWGGGL